MQITKALIDYLIYEYSDEKTKQSLHISISTERIQELDASYITEAAFIYKVMSLSYSDKTGNYGPLIILSDGSRSFDVEDIKDDNWSFLNALLEEEIPVVIKARINDLFWTVHKEYGNATKAIDCYINLYKLTLDPCHWIICERYIKRALKIALSLKKSSIQFKSTCSFIREEIIRINAEDPLFLSIELISDLLEVGYSKIKCFIPVLDKVIGRSSSDIHKTEEAFKLKLLIVKDDKDQLKITRNDYAISLENYASRILEENYQGLTSKIYFLKKAAIEYKYSRNKECENRIMLEIERLQVLSMASMPTISIPFEIDKNYYDKLFEEIETKGFHQSIALLTSMISYKSVDSVKEDLKKRKKGLFSSLFASSIIDSNGKNSITIPPIDLSNPEQNKEIYELHLIREAHFMEDIEGSLIVPVLRKIIKKYNPTDEQIEALFYSKYMIPKGRLPIFIFAFRLVFSGNLYAAVHILSAQMEHLFRMLAKTLGDVTYRIEEKGSRETEISLSEIFDLPHLSECLDERLLFTFKGLMNERAGANIRNRVAHGILDPEEGESGIVIYFICAVLKLLMGNY